MDVTIQSPSQRALNNFGFLMMLLGCPFLTWYATIAIRYYDGALVWPDLQFLSHIALPTLPIAAFYLCWVALQIAFAVFLPGKTELGIELENGKQLPYVMNGLSAFVLTLGFALALGWSGLLAPTFLYDNLDALVTTANVAVLALCGFMYKIGREQATAKERMLNPLEAYVIGAALNPRTRGLDWKFFCESRPGMILWILMDFSFAAAQYARHGTISNAMLLVVAFQLLYVADYFVMEDAILTTWDIRHEPFGFMLCWGCLVWIPFTFSLQGLYLVDHPQPLPIAGVILLVAFNLAGYAIFRGSNLQKHKFRKSQDGTIWGRPQEYIQTARGSRLLVSGFWGIARHSNYLGDLMMGLAWCMTTGFARILPYFYIIYFTILLINRERRDNDHCARKYGADWDAYTARVRWRIFPGIY
jgi:Delta14-sterol reductase